MDWWYRSAGDPPPLSLLAGLFSALPLFTLAGGSGTQTSASTGLPRWPLPIQTTSKGADGAGSDLLALPGFSSVPPKLIKRIIDKHYVEIWELLPETWQLESESTCCHVTKRPRRSLVTDISIWTECYATMAAILSAAYPDKGPQLFAYLRTITKASRTFETAAWASYDVAFRRQAANRGSLDWGVIDPALYNEAFAGRAKVIPRCRYCLGDTHVSADCPNAPAGPSPNVDIPPTAPPSRRPQGGGPARDRGATVEICRLFNSPGGSRCKYPLCRFAHLCLKCKGPHSVAECSLGAERRRQGPPTQLQMHPSGPPTTSA